MSLDPGGTTVRHSGDCGSTSESSNTTVRGRGRSASDDGESSSTSVQSADCTGRDPREGSGLEVDSSSVTIHSEDWPDHDLLVDRLSLNPQAPEFRLRGATHVNPYAPEFLPSERYAALAKILSVTQELFHPPMPGIIGAPARPARAPFTTSTPKKPGASRGRSPFRHSPVVRRGPRLTNRDWSFMPGRRNRRPRRALNRRINYTDEGEVTVVPETNRKKTGLRWKAERPRSFLFYKHKGEKHIYCIINFSLINRCLLSLVLAFKRSLQCFPANHRPN